MSGISKEMTVNQVLKLYPKSVGVFTKFNIDACCGGNRSLEQAAKEDKAALEELMTALDQCIQ
jgi:regulator of cell morphogenesis and NO signaling